ncbi:MAG: hypothetical protein A3D31_12115 [Candidatus Fluviicola riflensis]|nr:MAG: hypothetical protein CHH17_16550 [Candidatus Fluviicola riflensis]OGS77730.1 MAG: hypothetical protein A3D31_12115 [Candidatus Fluviicola riflensis]OGS84313.1 MAG: hypothetical protein A3E30_13525 [Fluviicola sp. RIFCSPHIGHO2_12_FULL_43_24]OGS84796.1 MAG: hypothetical protein A2724_09050 [Fluviicola sp. RIFCSPHIGHO2_01_FULL_43_53]
MVIYKITLDLFGDNFSPNKILDQIELNPLIVDSSERGDKIWPGQDEEIDFGKISVLNPCTYGLQHDNWEYEEWYVQFIEKNHTLLKLHGVDEIHFFIDVFYSGDQCNIEVFNKEIFKRLNKHITFSIPLSVYHLKQKEIKEMLLEVGFTKKEISSL